MLLTKPLMLRSALLWTHPDCTWSLTCVLCKRSVRFHQPYEHVLRVPLEESDRRMSIRQAPFDAQGFASTGASTYMSISAPGLKHGHS